MCRVISRLAQWVERASHIQRLCPRCSGPGFDSRPGSLCHSPSLSFCFLSKSSAVLSIKPKRPKKGTTVTDVIQCPVDLLSQRNISFCTMIVFVLNRCFPLLNEQLRFLNHFLLINILTSTSNLTASKLCLSPSHHGAYQRLSISKSIHSFL